MPTKYEGEIQYVEMTQGHFFIWFSIVLHEDPVGYL